MNILLVALVAGVFSVQFVPLEASRVDEDYPFMVELTNGTDPECFGVIIRRDAILTTASCIDKIQPTIRVMYRTEETSKTKRLRATAYPKTVTVPKKWNSTRPHLYDIALVFLNESITTDFIQTVDLETKAYYKEYDVDDSNKKSVKWVTYSNDSSNSYSGYTGGHLDSEHKCNKDCSMQNDDSVICYVDTRDKTKFPEMQIGVPLLHKREALLLFDYYDVMGLSSPVKSCNSSGSTWFTPVSIFKDFVQLQLEATKEEGSWSW